MSSVSWSDDGKVIELIRSTTTSQSSSFKIRNAMDAADALHYMSDIPQKTGRGLAAMALALDLAQATSLDKFDFNTRLQRTAEMLRTALRAGSPDIQRLQDLAAQLREAGEPPATIACRLYGEATIIAQELGATPHSPA
jgi:hypothetical protein